MRYIPVARQVARTERFRCEHQYHRDCTPECSCPHDGSSQGVMLIDHLVLAHCAVVVPERFKGKH